MVTGSTVAALVDHVRAVRSASRLRPAPPAPPGTPAVSLDQVRWWRLAATHATTRLPAGSYATAAHGGLQDSAPRAALVALHARVEAVDPPAWEHPDLAQLWFRWSDYVVPQDDLGVFSLGALPRDPRHAAALEALADAVVAAAPGGRRNSHDVMVELDWLPHRSFLRAASAAGRVGIRWDARTTEVVVTPRPDTDTEAGRLELGRRFLRWHAPATSSHFAKWAGVARADADATWSALAPELVDVALDGRLRNALAADLDDLLTVTRPVGVTRLLPMGDPLQSVPDVWPANPPLVPDAGAAVTSRLINSLAGRIVTDGDVVGAWGRARTAVTLLPYAPLAAGTIDAVTAEAESLAGPIGAPMQVRWLRPVAP